MSYVYWCSSVSVVSSNPVEREHKFVDSNILILNFQRHTYMCFIYFNRMALEEDIDSMKVKASQDAATIHEMRVALEQEKEGKTWY